MMLHDEVIQALVSAYVEECTDMRMVQARDQHRLALEALAAFRMIRKVLGKHLDGDRAMESSIERPIDFAHAPGRNQRLDLIRTEQAAGQAAGPWARFACAQAPEGSADSRKPSALG